MVVTQQYLIREQSSQNHRLVVGEASVPHLAIQFEQGLEPLVKWFDSLASSPKDFSPARAAEEFAALATPLLSLAAGRDSAALLLGIATILRAQETSSRALAFLSPLNDLAVGVVVVAAVRCDIVGALRYIRNLAAKSRVLAGARRGDRCQQRPHRTVGSRHHHFVAVALHPAIVLAEPPGAIATHTMKTSRNAIRLAVFLMPLRPQGFDHTFVYRHNRGICQAFLNGLQALQANRFLVQPLGTAITVKVRTAS